MIFLSGQILTGAWRNTGPRAAGDCWTREEYLQGHIPGSQNLDVQEIQKAPSLLPDKEAALFVYCHSGARSGQAAFMLKKMGYTNVTNIGGIMDYHGQIER